MKTGCMSSRYFFCALLGRVWGYEEEVNNTQKNCRTLLYVRIYTRGFGSRWEEKSTYEE